MRINVAFLEIKKADNCVNIPLFLIECFFLNKINIFNNKQKTEKSHKNIILFCFILTELRRRLHFSKKLTLVPLYSIYSNVINYNKLKVTKNRQIIKLQYIQKSYLRFYIIFLDFQPRVLFGVQIQKIVFRQRTPHTDSLHSGNKKRTF